MSSPVDFFGTKHLGCFNDGIFVSIHSDENKVGGVSRDNNVLTLRLLDPKDKGLLYEFKGSLDRNATDDAGNSTYIADVISSQTDMVDVETGDIDTIHPLSDIYGYSNIGKEKWITSPVQNYLKALMLSNSGYSLQDRLHVKVAVHASQLQLHIGRFALYAIYLSWRNFL